MILNKRTKRIPAKRSKPRVVHSERTEHITGHRRIRLTGKAHEARRAEIFERAHGRCEEIISVATWGDPFMDVIFGAGTFRAASRCKNKATEWSHKRHGANKCDCMDCGIASCSDCHRKRHQPKVVPRKELA